MLLYRKFSAYKVPKVWTTPKMDGKFASINAPTAGPRRTEALPKGKHPIQLYSMGTPNGVKITAMLEELVDMVPGFEVARDTRSLPPFRHPRWCAPQYDAWMVNIMKGDQFTSGFVDVNPNSKIPCMVDYSDEARPIRIFESG
jgi:GST-like protein